jgi:NhaP-type Na+/H+ or K+/H+ antiporter
MPLAPALVEALSIAAAPANVIQEDISRTAKRHGVARLLSFISHLVLFLLIGAQAKLRLPVHWAVPVEVDQRCGKGPG